MNIPRGRITLFADDTNIQMEATRACMLNDKITETMQQLSSWFYLNKLVINSEKPLLCHSILGKTKITEHQKYHCKI
jgi:hypothetical protein